MTQLVLGFGVLSVFAIGLALLFWRWCQHHGSLGDKLARDILLEPHRYSVKRQDEARSYFDDRFAEKIMLFVDSRSELIVDRSGGGGRARQFIRELNDWLHDPLKKSSTKRCDQAHLALAGWYHRLGDPSSALGHLSQVSDQLNVEVLDLRQSIRAAASYH